MLSQEIILLLLIWFGRLTYIEVKKPSEEKEPRGGCSINQQNIHQLWFGHDITGTVLYTSQQIVDYVLAFTNLKF